MTKEQIERINELARKQKEIGLSPAEKEEQHSLREAYLRDFRANFQSQLDRIYIEREDGSYEKLQKKQP